MKRKPVTAAELLAALSKDADHVTRRQAEDEAFAQKGLELRAAEAPLLDELRRTGVSVGSVWDLVARREPYPSVLPTLLDHLQRQYPSPVREGIARALAVPQAAFGWTTLVSLFRNEDEVRVKDGIAVALAATVNDASLSDLIQLASEPSHGASRILLLQGLAKSRTKRAIDALHTLSSDPTLTHEITRILRGGNG